jgi:hypothetical protein
MEPSKKALIKKVRMMENRMNEMCDMIDYLRAQQGTGDIQAGPPLPNIAPTPTAGGFGRVGMGKKLTRAKKEDSDDGFDDDDLLDEVEGKKQQRGRY